ncbi:MAG: TPM domain-containing protein [Velocimicrobium sp.]
MKQWMHQLPLIFFFGVLLLGLLSPQAVFASEVTYVSDDAALFTDDEKEALEDTCREVSNTNDLDIIILTINGTDLTRKQYIENYYDSMDSVLSDAVILLINMDSDNRGVELQGYGDCESTLSDDRIESILDDITPYLSDGAYYNSMNAFIDDVDYYVNLTPTTNYQHTEQDNQNYREDHSNNNNTVNTTSFTTKSLRNLLIAVVIGVISVLIMAYNSGGRMTTTQSAYLDASHSKILGQYDHYVRTTTTRVPKPKPPQNNSGGGFGGGGVSAGGSSHSGGGRSF